MMSIIYLFWMYVVLFGLIGSMRGWARELLVAFSVVTALAMNFLLKKYLPLMQELPGDSSSLFWIRSIIVLALVFFGYQTINILPRFESKARRERLQDALFGFVLGGINGYLVAGTLLYYYHVGEYPYKEIISKATDADTIASIATMMKYMPPHFLGEPGIYFAPLIILIFIIVVYV